MRNIFTYLGVTALFVSGTVSAAGAERVIVPSGGETSVLPKRAAVISQSDIVPSPLKVRQNASSVEREIELIRENFDMIPEGNTEYIDGIGNRCVDMLASHHYQPGRYLDTAYTPESGTWEGDYVFAGNGGTVVLQAFSPFEGAYIATPLGEYSGDLTVKVRCRYAKTFYGGNSESGYVTTLGSDLYLTIGVGGYDSMQYADSDAMYGLQSGPIYENEGWMVLTFKLCNKSADNDAYLMFGTSSAIELDWIEVTDAGTYLAAPSVKEVRDFTRDGFTISWDKVRRSSNYYIDLWKVNYTADSGVDETIDFEDAKLPDGWSADEAEIENGYGDGESFGLQLGYNGTEGALITEDFGKKLDILSFGVYFDINNPEAYDENYDLGALCVEGLTIDGWQPISQTICDGFFVRGGRYYNYKAEGPNFESKYTAIRFYALGLSDDNHIRIDNVALWAKRPYELVRDENSDMLWDVNDDDNNYNYYTYVDNNVYTFTGLDPEGEYWYRVRSHNVQEFNNSEKYHAFGVASPELLPATDIKRDGYTAHWNDVPKAQNYIVKSFKSEKVTADQDKYTIFAESFSDCEGTDDYLYMMPAENLSGDYLDGYTDMAGWTGADVTVGASMIGGTFITTPPLPVNPARGSYYIYLEAYGYPGDIISIEFLNAGVSQGILVEGDGMTGYISGYIEVSEAVAGEKIRFSSLNYVPFGLVSFEVLQDVKAGDIISTFHSDTLVAAGVEQCVFTELEDNSLYSYQVISRYDLEQESVYSTGNDKITVDLSVGNSNLTAVGTIENDIVEVSRYTVSGIRVGEDYNGVVIVRMSDGSTRKVISE